MGAWRAVERVTQGEREGEHPPKRTVPPPVILHTDGDWGVDRSIKRVSHLRLVPRSQQLAASFLNHN
jgi:hypothetical protein